MLGSKMKMKNKFNCWARNEEVPLSRPMDIPINGLTESKKIFKVPKDLFFFSKLHSPPLKDA